MKTNLLILTLTFPLAFWSYGQTAMDTIPGLPPGLKKSLSDRSLRRLEGKYSDLAKTVDRQSRDLLDEMEKQEATLQQKLSSKDSSAARQVFTDLDARYEAMKARLQAPLDKTIAHPLKEYIPGLDSMQTAMKWLSGGNLAENKLQEVQALNDALQRLQSRLQAANEVQDFARQREQQLDDQLSRYGLNKQLLGMNKTVYYYQQQLVEYKQLFNDKDKMEKTLLAAARQSPAFKSFMKKNGLLAQLFPVPENYGSIQSMDGVQTRDQMSSMISGRIGSATPGAPGALEYMDQQAQAGQSAMDKLKDKLRQLGSGAGNTNMTMPNFAPNNQKTKKFLQRLEYGMNIQNTPGTNLLPAMSAIALTVGYKLTDKATCGVGTSYNLGWGSGIDHIKFSSQGIGLRSYVDIKAKGSIWITGGFEYNYIQQFSSLNTIRDLDIWQKSGLVGLTKKYHAGKRGGDIQLLYDLLAGNQVPRATPLKFRIGFSL